MQTKTVYPRRLEGEVVVDVPFSLMATGWILIGLVIVVAIFAAFAQYSRKETVSGWISPAAGLIRVTARQGGIVDRLEVTEGQRVPRGASLAVLRLSDRLEGGADVGASLSLSLRSEAEALEALHRAEIGALRASAVQLAAERRQSIDEVRELERGIAILDRQKEIAMRQLARIEEISRQGYVSQQMLDDRRTSVLELDRQVSAARGSLIARRAEVADVGIQMSALKERRASLDAQSAQASAALAQRQVTATSTSRYAVDAPFDGVVAVLPLNAGQSVDAGGTVAVIAPHGSRLRAEMYVPARSSGFLKRGQKVRLMLQAYPYQKFGAVNARIAVISAAALDPREISVPGLNAQEPMVRVTADLDTPSISVYGEDRPLQAGMLLRADIILDRRSLLEWLLGPLLEAWRRG